MDNKLQQDSYENNEYGVVDASKQGSDLLLGFSAAENQPEGVVYAENAMEQPVEPKSLEDLLHEFQPTPLDELIPGLEPSRFDPPKENTSEEGGQAKAEKSSGSTKKSRRKKKKSKRKEKQGRVENVQAVQASQEVQYDQEVQFSQGAEFIQEVQYDQAMQYIQEAQYDQSLQYSQEVQYAQGLEYVQDVQYLQDMQYDAQDIQYAQEAGLLQEVLYVQDATEQEPAEAEEPAEMQEPEEAKEPEETKEPEAVEGPEVEEAPKIVIPKYKEPDFFIKDFELKVESKEETPDTEKEDAEEKSVEEPVEEKAEEEDPVEKKAEDEKSEEVDAESETEVKEAAENDDTVEPDEAVKVNEAEGDEDEETDADEEPDANEETDADEESNAEIDVETETDSETEADTTVEANSDSKVEATEIAAEENSEEEKQDDNQEIIETTEEAKPITDELVEADFESAGEKGKPRKRIKTPIKVRKRQGVTARKPEASANSMEKNIFFDWKLRVAGAVILVLVVLAFVKNHQYNEVMKENDTLRSQIEVMENNMVKLTAENESLNEKVTLISDTLTQKASELEGFQKEEESKYSPTGFPFAGPAALLECTETPKEAMVNLDAIKKNDEETDAADKDKKKKKRKPGIDNDGNPITIFSATAGTRVIATASGTVVEVAPDDTFGYRVVIDHGNGLKSIYRDAAMPSVSEKEEITKGQTIFEMQSSEDVLGYQILNDEKYKDPLELMEIYG